MKLSKAIAIVALAALTLMATNVQAQQSWSKSWEESSSWNSSWGTGPNGTHSTFDQQSNQKSSETFNNGGRTTNITQDHSQQSGFSRGTDQFGTYNNEYANQKGKSVFTDQNRMFGPYGGQATQTQQITNQYDNRQGLNQSWGTDGSYNQGGYNDRSGSTTTHNDFRGTDAFGNSFGQGQIQTIGLDSNSSYNMGFDRYGRQIMNQQLNGGKQIKKGNAYRW